MFRSDRDSAADAAVKRRAHTLESPQLTIDVECGHSDQLLQTHCVLSAHRGVSLSQEAGDLQIRAKCVSRCSRQLLPCSLSCICFLCSKQEKATFSGHVLSDAHSCTVEMGSTCTKQAGSSPTQQKRLDYSPHARLAAKTDKLRGAVRRPHEGCSPVFSIAYVADLCTAFFDG